MAKAIMIQGTCSNAGKSIIAAGLCRIFTQDGFSTAPFKAQNMALNSYVTADSKEMGRAQVTQSYACRKEPDVRMNPILLKPNSETGSQVIVMGKPIGNMDFRKYKSYKSDLLKTINEAYFSLAAENQIMVLEGAGSPAEINLKENDIVNMNMAKMANANVLIVGDIDRGGVFAGFVGTYELLEPAERELVKGFIINKFRGDETFLTPAIDFLTKRTSKKVYGVVPYLQKMKLPDEDSVDWKNSVGSKHYDQNYAANVALIDLPHISNFTDFDPLKYHSKINFYPVNQPQDLGKPDIIILPGSKNVIADMLYLKQNHWEGELRSFAEQGTMILGICGGYQMLGKIIEDPHHLESEHASVPGLGLLDLKTVLEKEKDLKQTNAYWEEKTITGYEIHHGQTVTTEKPWITGEDSNILGVSHGQIRGTYLHGIFDNPEFLTSILKEVMKDPGVITNNDSYNLETELDLLAKHLRKTLDIQAIYQLLGINHHG
ncbi:MAG: cobyric acid synthase [Spirochaetes bacterium]|nr:cobyric acid synthase [Spirochaetota bacterium]